MISILTVVLPLEIRSDDEALVWLLVIVPADCLTDLTVKLGIDGQAPTVDDHKWPPTHSTLPVPFIIPTKSC